MRNQKLKILPKKTFFRAKVIKILGNLSVTKTIKVQLVKRVYLSKYKRFYKKSYTYLVHHEPKEQNPIQLGQLVKIYPCRKLSARKSMVTYGWE